MSNIKCNINENVSSNEIVMYYLHNDYEKRTLLLQELSSHIEQLYDTNIIYNNRIYETRGKPANCSPVCCFIRCYSGVFRVLTCAIADGKSLKCFSRCLSETL